MKYKIVFIHASPAAIAPLNLYFQEHAKEMEWIHMLDDGLMSMFKNNDMEKAVERITKLITDAREYYQVQAAIITCSSLSLEATEEISSGIIFPLFKIDKPMAQQAVAMGEKIGLVASFEPGMKASASLLLSAACDAGKKIEIIPVLETRAYDALLSGDAELHNNTLLKAILENLKNNKPDVLVLSQVSMIPVAGLVRNVVDLPVLTPAETCLGEVRKLIKTG